MYLARNGQRQCQRFAYEDNHLFHSRAFLGFCYNEILIPLVEVWFHSGWYAMM